MTTLVTIKNHPTIYGEPPHNILVTNRGGYGKTLKPGEECIFHVWYNGDLVIKELEIEKDKF
jgi:hypothetical protein